MPQWGAHFVSLLEAGGLGLQYIMLQRLTSHAWIVLFVQELNFIELYVQLFFENEINETDNLSCSTSLSAE